MWHGENNGESSVASKVPKLVLVCYMHEAIIFQLQGGKDGRW